MSVCGKLCISKKGEMVEKTVITIWNSCLNTYI